MILDTVYVKDFTTPGDEDSADGIRRAIEYAINTGAHTVVFEKGEYRLESTVRIHTEAMRHDAGYEDSPLFKDCHIYIHDEAGLELIGAADEKDEIATVLAGDNPFSSNEFLPSVLWCEACTGLTVKNISFTRNENFASAGEVTAVKSDSVTVRVFDGNPCYDNMEVYCANRFTKDRELYGESLTYGQGIKDRFKLTADRTLELHDARIAGLLKEGELISWHQGAKTDFQVYFGHCDNLTLYNIRTYNSNGFCMLTEGCRNITAYKVVFKPEGNQLFCAPRDAWKIFKCSGIVDIDNMYVEGVRMDGQNIQCNWLIMHEKLGNNEAVFFCKYTYLEIKRNSYVEFWNNTEIKKLRVKMSEKVCNADNGYYYRVVFFDTIPDFAVKGTLASAECWRPQMYRCRNSVFKNIAGAGHLIRTSGAVIERCHYINTMNPGILIGSELPVHYEGVHGSDIIIDSCTFDNCGFCARYGAGGCVGIKSHGFSGELNRNILISGCLFRNSETAVHAMDCRDVIITGSNTENIGKKIEPADTNAAVWL